MFLLILNTNIWYYTDMQTEINLLRQHIIELKVEKAELKAEFEAKNSKIPKLKKKFTEVEIRNIKIEARNAKLMKQMIEENNWCDVRIKDISDKVVKLEQKQLQNDNTSNNNLSNFNSDAKHHKKLLKDKKMDNFLNKVHKKKIGDDIRWYNKKKKLQHESANQGGTFDTMHVSETINNIKKSDELEINKITNCTSLESSYEIEAVASQSVIADISQKEIPKSIANFRVKSKVLCDIKLITIGNRFSENLKLLHEKETITNTTFTFYLEIVTKRLKEKDSSSDRLLNSKEILSTINS